MYRQTGPIRSFTFSTSLFLSTSSLLNSLNLNERIMSFKTFPAFRFLFLTFGVATDS